jgi:hypothetical protein
MTNKTAQKSTALIPVGTNGTNGQEEPRSAPRPLITKVDKRLAEIDRLTHELCLAVARAMYAVGLLMLRNRVEDGEHALDNLATRLSERRGRTVRADELYYAGVVTSIYRWREIEELFTQAARANARLTWDHFSRGLSLLGKFEDTAFRKKCEGRLIAEDLSVEALCRVIDEYHNEPNEPRSGAGRRPRTPRNAVVACRQISTFCHEIAARLAGWEQSLFDWIAEAAPDDLTDELLGELRLTQSSVSAFRKTLEELLDKLKNAIARVKRVLKLREERQQEPAGKKLKDHEEEDVEKEWDGFDEDADIDVEEDEEDETEEDVEVEQDEVDEDADIDVATEGDIEVEV